MWLIYVNRHGVMGILGYGKDNTLSHQFQSGGDGARQLAKSKKPDFEKSLAGLEALVEKLEQGDLPLDTTLAEFEEGIKLARQCQQSLAAAEQKVEILLAGDDAAKPAPFDPD